MFIRNYGPLRTLTCVVMVYRLPIKFEGASPLLSTSGEVQSARFSVVPRARWEILRRSVVSVIHNISIVIRVVSVVRETEAQLTGAITVTVRRYWRAAMWVRVAQAVTVRRCRKVAQVVMRISQI